MQCSRQSLRALGRRFCRLAELLAEHLPLCYLSRDRWNRRLFTSCSLLGVAKHVVEASEDMTNGRTLLGRFCREYCRYGCFMTAQ